LRSKSRQSVAVSSSVVRPPPVKSSVQRIEGGAEVKRQQIDTRQVVHKEVHPDSASPDKPGEAVSSTGHRKHSGVDKSEESRKSSAVEAESSSTARSYARSDATVKGVSRTALEGRKVSVMDEDEFEPDYNETETSEMEVAADEKSLQQSSGHKDSDKINKSGHRDHSHHRHKASRQESTDVDESGSKTKKHKKQKKHKKHKSKNKKADK
jgi:hypothetical protein